MLRESSYKRMRSFSIERPMTAVSSSGRMRAERQKAPNFAEGELIE
jgi:hypothetical protein